MYYHINTLYVILIFAGFKMPSQDSVIQERVRQAAKRAIAEAKLRHEQQSTIQNLMPKEINGPKGAEPTRYDDWERKGIAYDF